MYNPSSQVIVVVEDDPTMAWVLGKVISQLASGYTVHICAHGLEALDYLAGNDACCIITDYLMPHMNGVALARKLIEQWPKLPVVLITGGKVAQVRNEALAAGCMIVLEKPILPVHLQAVMQSVLSAKPIDS